MVGKQKLSRSLELFTSVAKVAAVCLCIYCHLTGRLWILRLPIVSDSRYQGESIGLVNRAKRGYGAVMLCRIAVDRRDAKTGLKTNTNKAGLADTIERQHLVKQLEKTLAGYAKNAVVYHERQTEKIALCGAVGHKCTYGGCSDSSDPKAEDNEFALRGCTLDLPPALIDGEKIDKKEYEAMVL